MSCVPVVGAVCAAMRSMANTAPSEPINTQTAKVFIRSSLSLDQCHAVGGLGGMAQSCVDVSPVLIQKQSISRARRHPHFVSKADISLLGANFSQSTRSLRRR